MNNSRKGVKSLNNRTREQDLTAFVNREVIFCQTVLVEKLLQNHIFSVSDIENLYRPFDGELLNPSICISCSIQFPFLDSETGWCDSCFEALQTPQEIFEWWLVSGWFAHKLLLHGEALLKNEYGTWWGRTTTGQAIKLDAVIEKIYDEIAG